jgi:DNA-directed RNA polymerase subunit RPC12/RpoP
MSEESLRMSVPLDADGFLRRECPTCEREFKWLPSPSGDGENAADAESLPYTCPYCGIRAPAESWATKAQVALAQSIVMREIVGPQLEELGRQLERTSRQTGGLISFSAHVQRDEPTADPTLTESDDMRRVDFPCHPAEPIKVLEDWAGDVLCLVCGAPAIS